MSYRSAVILSLTLISPAFLIANDRKPEQEQQPPSQSGMVSADMVSLFYAMWSRYAEAITSANADKAADFFTEDAILMQPKRADIVGKPAIRKFFTDLFANVKYTDESITPGETRICGDFMYQFGTFHESAQQGKATAGYDGRYFSVWQRQSDGSWKMSRLMMSNTE